MVRQLSAACTRHAELVCPTLDAVVALQPPAGNLSRTSTRIGLSACYRGDSTPEECCAALHCCWPEPCLVPPCCCRAVRAQNKQVAASKSITPTGDHVHTRAHGYMHNSMCVAEYHPPPLDWLIVIEDACHNCNIQRNPALSHKQGLSCSTSMPNISCLRRQQ
jgi:hypothetical protein